jgi:tungstate transport system ATP-binding protein
MNENVLELHDIGVRYDGRTVLDVPHLAIRRGEVLTLLGENGSGKTSLLRLLGLLVRPFRGRVLFDGEEVDFENAQRLLKLRRQTAAVMQEPLLCRMSVRQNVALGLKFRRLPKPETDRRVDTWLRRLSILHLEDRPASKLSGGEAQRTSLARAMALNPEVLFLDEPFASLDAPTRQSLLHEFQAVLAESGVTALFATHDRGEALGLGDRVAVLMDGKLAQVGSAEAVFSRPEQVAVARFVGVDTLIPGCVVATAGELVQVECGGLRLEAKGVREAGEEVFLSVRPEEIHLYDDVSFVGDGKWNRLAGPVTRIVPTETHYRVELDCGTPVVALVGRARFRNLALEVGRPVRAMFTPEATHLIPRGTDEQKPNGRDDSHGCPS